MTFQALKEMLGDWPAAIPLDLICDPGSEDQKTERGNNIIAFFLTENLAGKKLLDFGCGEGHAVRAAKSRGASVALGYDILPQGPFGWDEDNGDLFTNWDAIRESGPFDFVLAYDVLDHVADPVKVMEQIKSVTNRQSAIYVLTHPWCSRHGGHLYHNFNYAFAHVIFTDDELREMGMWEDHGVQPLVNPINKYKAWFEPHFTINRSEVTKDTAEEFFRRPLITERIINRFNTYNPIFKAFPQFQLEQSFHEYVLKVK